MAASKAKFTEGPIFFRLIWFTLPIMFSGLLQVAYNMADNMVVGSFSGDTLALGAVGSTVSLTGVVVGLLMGVATGAGVVIAQFYGAKDYDRMRRSVHTSVTFSFIAGVTLAVLLFFLAKPLLTFIGTKPEFLSRAVLYVKIIAIGVPASTVYNFGSTIFRSVGDSKTPLIILAISGLVNVGLNFFFVLVFEMSVAGVAIATVVSQYLSALAVLLLLVRKRKECYGLNFKELTLDGALLKKILRYGLPAGLQSSLFGISNIMITSAVNTLPSISVTARTIAQNMDSLVYTSMNSFLHSVMTFVGQNYGAANLKRIKKTAIYAVLQVTAVGLLVAFVIVFCSRYIVNLFIDANDPNKAAIADEAIGLMRFFLSLYFLCGVMETLSGVLRGMGNSLAPMIISIAGSCGIRAIWAYGFFPNPALHSLTGLYICYPISWGFCVVAMAIALIFTWRKTKKRFASASLLGEATLAKNQTLSDEAKPEVAVGEREPMTVAADEAEQECAATAQQDTARAEEQA